MPALRDIPALDGMRGVAAALVVGFHAMVFAIALPETLGLAEGLDLAVEDRPAAKFLLQWGFIGVDFFFVLSAFLLAQPFLARGVRPALRGYTSKRLLRVVPPYYASLAIGWILVGHTGHGWFRIDAHQLWTHLAFLHGFWRDTQLSVNPVYWTLAVELQFYLLLPLLVVPFRGRTALPALATALAATLLYRWWAFGPDPWVTRYHEGQLPAYLWHFALGIAMARARFHLRDRVFHRAWLDAGIAAAVAVFILLPSFLLRNHPTAFGIEEPGMLVLYRPLVATGFALVILLSCIGRSRVTAFLESPPLMELGRVSYSLYLLHFPVSAWLLLRDPGLFDLRLGDLALLLTVASILAAIAFHAAVEAPALRLKDRYVGWASRRGRPEAPPVAGKP